MRRWTIPGLVVLILLAVIALLTTTDPNKKEGSRVEKVRAEPSFIREGELFFIQKDPPDTLTRIDIEIADEASDIRQGLMYRSSMGKDQGMLFIFDQEIERSFWMKNTMISLDIIFIDADYKIIHIAEHTLPYSTDPVPSIHPAMYVLEVNAGFCRDHGIREGHHIIYNRE